MTFLLPLHRRPLFATVDTADLSHAITLLMDADLWPAGVFVKRYYKPTHGSEQS